MDEVLVSVNEDEAPHVQQRYISFLVRRWWREGFARHLVAACRNGSGLRTSPEEATFNSGLKFFFLCVLTFAVISLIIIEQLLTHSRLPNASTWNYTLNQTWLFGYFPIGKRGTVLLSVFAAAVVVGVLVKKTIKSGGSAPARREQVQTISALVQRG